jgi:type I restriction enzyme S subunit
VSDDGLPEGWAAATLGDGLTIDVQPGFACGAHSRDSHDVPHLRPMNVSQEGRIDLSNLKFVPKKEVDREARLLRFGDVLFNNTNSPELVGKTACYDLPEPRAFSNHMTRVRCHPKALDPHYCALVLHTKWMDGYFASICNNHVSQASISRAVLVDTPIALAPLAEQERIVAKVEALLAHVNAARQALAKVPAILKRFRQSVLAAACSGRLTADWREVGAIGDIGAIGDMLVFPLCTRAPVAVQLEIPDSR